MARAAVIDSNNIASVVHPTRAIKYRWVPPSSVHEDDDDYHGYVLREDNYL